jgi:hypothetical protein
VSGVKQQRSTPQKGRQEDGTTWQAPPHEIRLCPPPSHGYVSGTSRCTCRAGSRAQPRACNVCSSTLQPLDMHQERHHASAHKTYSNDAPIGCFYTFYTCYTDCTAVVPKQTVPKLLYNTGLPVPCAKTPAQQHSHSIRTTQCAIDQHRATIAAITPGKTVHVLTQRKTDNTLSTSIHTCT